MGFYGNITNTNKTSFNFDTVYPNRALMDSWATTDGVFLGRYVLVEYDMECDPGSLPGIYPEDSAEGKTNYEINFLIDKTKYGTTSSRLYDSTVWQKVYTDDGERYVMIAELNSVVPTLRLTVDKPEEGRPGTPYFSEESNNIDYQLHWEPQWGFKVGNIAFNEAGFDKHNKNAEVSNPNDRIYFTKEKSGTQYPVYATDPATKSKYIASMAEADDIQVLNIDLPSIGNMISKGYDVIYGENRDNSPSGSLQGYLNFFTTSIKNNEIPVRSSSGAMIGATITDDAWINTTVDAASKNIQITHADATKNKSTATAAVTGNTIDLYTPQVDAKGHVTGSITTTTTLPYGYKTITTNGKGTDKQVNESVNLKTDNISAKNTVDTLALNSANPWIRINADAQNNTMTFAHSVNSVDTKDKVDTDLNADTATGTIRVYDIAHDAAGHIIGNQKHNYVLPYGYKKINSGAVSTSTENGTSNSVSIIAKNAKDEFTIAPGNKWILTSANADSKTLTLAHEVHSIDSNPIEQHTALDSANGTITIKDIEFDNAGHAISNKNHVYDLPFAIRNIQVNSSNATTAGVNSSGTIEADKYNDTLILSTQNRWITLKADPATDAIVIGHAAANNTSTTTAGATEASAPKFGATFTVPYIKYDGTGHIAENGNRTITIPKGSLEDKLSTASTANVLTNMSFDAENGKITTEHQNVGKLLLTDFTALGSLAAGNDAIKATDTVNEAFGKIEYLLNQETGRATGVESALSKQITDTVAGLNVSANNSDGYSLVSTVSESEGKISTTVADVENIKLRTTPSTSDATSIQADDTLKAALGKLQAQVNSNKNSIETLTNGVDADKVDSVTDLIQYVEKHGETTQGLIDAIGKQATDAESATGIYALIDVEKETRDLADQNINKRIDELVKVTNDQISQWDKAEANVQVDWNETDNTKDSFILNKPDNLVTNDQIANMALKSDLNSMVRFDSQFEYIPSTTVESTGEVTEAVMLTIQGLMDKVRQLESRISELEKEEVPENNGAEPEPEPQ